MGWVQFIYYVVVLIISVALAPKPPKPKPAALEDFEVPLAEEDRPIPVVFGKVLITGPNVTWYGDLGSTKIKKSSLFGSTTLGYKYYLGIDFKLCHGPIDSLTKITVGEKLAWSGSITDNAEGTINLPKLFGGDKREGGLVGKFDVMFGADDQTPNTYLAGVTTQNPGYRGVVSVVWTRKTGSQSIPSVRGILTSKVQPQGYIGTTPYLKPWAFEVTRLSSGWDGSVFYPEKLEIGDGGYNPAHIIYECLTNREWGMGDSSSSIDTTSFMDVADALFDEGFGLRFLWNRSTSIDDFIGIVLNHISGALNFNRSTGKYMLALFRADYEVDDLPSFDEDNVKAVTSFQRQLWGETVNEVAITYTDPETLKDSIVVAHDLANIQAQSARVSQKLSYTGVFDRDLASKIAMRELVMRSTPLAKVSFIANRLAWPLKRGDVIKLSWARLGLVNVVLRVLNVPSGGTLRDGPITIEAIEDIFGLPSSTYIQPQDPESPVVVPDPPDDLDVDNSNNVLSSSLTAPPSSPADGDRYLVPLTGVSGAWVGLEGTLVEWSEDEGLWIPVEVPPGQIIYDQDSGQHVGTDEDGGATETPFTPAIPPLTEETSPDLETAFLVLYDPITETYKKVLANAVGGEGAGGSNSPLINSLTDGLWYGRQSGTDLPTWSRDGRFWFVNEDNDEPVKELLFGSDERYHGLSGQTLGRSSTRNIAGGWTYTHPTSWPTAGFSGGIAWDRLIEHAGNFYAWSTSVNVLSADPDYPFIVVSTDNGDTFEEVGANDLDKNFYLIDLKWIDSDSRWLAFGHLREEPSPGVYEYRPRVYYSTDLLTFTLLADLATTPLTDDWSLNVVAANGDNLVVGLTNNTSGDGELYYSTDAGDNWTHVGSWPTTSPTQGIIGAAWDGTRYLVSGRDWVARSTNLSSWTTASNIFGLDENFAYGFSHGGRTLFALTTASTFRTVYTDNGSTFTECDVLPANYKADRIAYDDSGDDVSAKTVQERFRNMTIESLLNVLADGAGEGAYLRRNASGDWIPVDDVTTDADTAGDPYWENVVALLKFDGSDTSTTMTDSTGKRTWTARGNAQLDTAQFKFGTASLLLDGTGDYIDTPNSTDFQVGSQNFTYEAWVRINSTGKIHTVFNKRDASSAEEHSFAIDASQHISATLFNSGSAIGGSAVGTTTLSTGVWYHVAYVRNGTSLMCFLDGNLEATQAVSTTAATTNTEVMKIGRDGFNTARDFDGWIDSVRITKGVARYTSSFTAPTDEWPTTARDVLLDDEIAVDVPMAYWKMDEPSGSLVDYSGNGYTLTLTGTAVDYQRAPIVPNSVKSYARMRGNGGTSYWSRSGTLGFSQPITSDWTVEGVVRLEETNSSDNHRLFVIGASGESTATNFQIYVYFVVATGVPSAFWEYSSGGTDKTLSFTKVAIPKGRPFHYAFVKNQATRTMQFYLDGALADELTWSSGEDMTGGTSCNTAIGDAFGSGCSGFTQAHLAVYNKVLTAARIRAHAVAAGFRLK
jgi:hypothetical protein